jgi:DNA adenine methylase
MGQPEMKTEIGPNRAICRYHGGKWRLAKWIVNHFPAHRFYIEPFGGAGSVLLRKPRSRCELYNDLDGEVVNYFRVLRDPGLAARLAALLELTPFAADEFKAAYEPLETADQVERARRFFVRMSLGWGTRMRSVNRSLRSRKGNDNATPAKEFSNYPKHIKSFTERLRGVVIENRPATQIIARHDEPDALFYLDPPYLHHLRKDWGRNTYSCEMTDEDHVALAETLYQVKGYVVVSGYPSELYDDLYTRRGWVLQTKKHHVEMNKMTTEGLWLSPRTAQALGGRLF